MSGGVESGEGVQVVRLGAGALRYELDEAALRRLLLQPDVRDLPAVVLSVAGAYRGGKSFILNFFLRYLNAPRSSQLSGEWLGKEDELLKGFHWRGGSDLDTIGIHLWSEPIIATLDTGEKVAVLLMDTQGTFDSESTIGENSTIFALSTLISSVQIYNLSGNIKADDLQHLQLFTKYGKLACEAESKAFQTLLFLVRDWACDYEQAHGFVGGAALLEKWLKSNPKQKPELREVREHVRSCFDQIKCFLMPHPGLTVVKQNFAGCLRDLTEMFRIQLLELVPALCDPVHLTPKLINGERVRTQDLLGYFQKYVDIFKSNEVPEVVTIYKATADACLLAAARAARSLYTARMEERVRGARSLAGSALAAAHNTARAAAELCFTQKRKLGEQQDADAQLKELLKELDAGLSLYVLKNNAMIRETMSLAKKTYDTAVSSVCGDDVHLCLHPDDLVELHAESLQEALKLFDAARDIPEDEEDDQRTGLVQSLKQQYDHLCAINEQNNKSAVLEAHNFYVMQMKLECDYGGVSSDKLKARNHQAVDDAKAFLNKQRNQSSEREDDPYIHQLLQEISSSYADFEKGNINSNRIAMQAAEIAYNNYIKSERGSQMSCFHPRALVDLHKKGVEAAIKQFMVNRAESEDGAFKAVVDKNLRIRFYELQKINNFNNEKAVEQAFMRYTMTMEEHTRPSALSLMVTPITKLMRVVPRHHERSKQLALSYFMSRRRGENYDDDNIMTILSRPFPLLVLTLRPCFGRIFWMTDNEVILYISVPFYPFKKLETAYAQYRCPPLTFLLGLRNF